MVESRKIHEELIKDREEQLDQHRMKAEEWKDNISKFSFFLEDSFHELYHFYNFFHLLNIFKVRG